MVRLLEQITVLAWVNHGFGMVRPGVQIQTPEKNPLEIPKVPQFPG